MESNKSYGEYELEVLGLLYKKIFTSKGENVNLEMHQPLNFQNSEGVIRHFDFDLAVWDSKGRLIEVYEICSPSAFERNLNSIRDQLAYYEEETGTKAHLAYKKDKGDLIVLSLQEVNDEIKKITSIKEEPIDSIFSFYKKLQQLTGNPEDNLRYFYRGHPNKKYTTIPSIYRAPHIIKNEGLIYHEAIRQLPEEFSEDMSTFDKLVKMQHYELPTRLLDVTSNALIALFFACLHANNSDNKEADGKVFVYSMLPDQIKYYDDVVVCLLANLVKRPFNFDFNDEKERNYLFEDTHKDAPVFNKNDNWGIAVHNVFCVLPKLNNDRIKKQSGAFFIFGMGDTKNEPAVLSDKPIEIIVKAEAKSSILRELNQLGINMGSLFPETDKMMQQIKSQFLL